MNRKLNNTYFKAIIVKDKMTAKVRKLLREEKGGAEILAVIILLAIVILLAVAFRKKIGDIVSKIWTAISGQEGKFIEPFTP